MTTLEIKENVEKALDEIRPFLNSDGGNISLVEIIEDKHVKVRLEGVFENITRNVVQETVNRNETLPPTEAIKITTMAGCSAVKK